MKKTLLPPDKIAFNSNKKQYWLCSENHSWFQGVSDRTGTRYKDKKSTQCPYCYQPSRSRNELIIFSELHYLFNSVTSTHRIYKKELDIFIEDLNLAIEYDGENWHKDTEKDIIKNNLFKKNGIDIIRIREKPLKLLSSIDYSYDIKHNLFDAILWILKHILKTYKLDNITKNKIEKYMKNGVVVNHEFLKKIVDTYKIKKITDKLLFKEFDSKNNLPLHYYGGGSDYRASWTCFKCEHKWIAPIRSRCNGTNKCPKCYPPNNKLNDDESLGKLYPLLKKELLSNVDTLKISPLSRNDNLLWSCFKCKHKWESSPHSRIHNRSGCTNCGFHILFKDSFLDNYPNLKKLWSKDNKKLKPEFLPENYSFKVFWTCENGHTTKEMISTKINRNKGCYECEKSSVVFDLKRLESEWDYTKNINIDPKKIKLTSKVKAFWKCSKGDDHKWLSPIHNRLNRGCPFCSNRKGFLSKTNRLDLIHPKISSEWNFSLNEDKPSDHTFRSGERRQWICSECNYKFESKISHRIDVDGFCPSCRKKNT